MKTVLQSGNSCWVFLLFIEIAFFQTPRLESLFSARGRYFSPSNLRALKTRPRIFSPYEKVYFSSISFKLCTLAWALRAWQLACARKIFIAHYILSSRAKHFKVNREFFPLFSSIIHCRVQKNVKLPPAPTSLLIGFLIIQH